MSDAAATCGKSLSVPELATLTGFAQDTIRGHLERGEWPGVLVGVRGVWRVPRAVADALAAGTDPRTLVVHAHTQGATWAK
jgi:hypothetical protein